MNSKLVIRIPKRTFQEQLLQILIFGPLSFGFLNDLLGLPYSLRYIMDIAWVALLFIMVAHRYTKKNSNMLALEVVAVLFFVMTLMVFPIQYQSVLYYLWGLRNNFRFYIAFFAFAAYLKQDNVEAYLKCFNILFWINIAVSLIQYFGFDIEQDFLGGIFGASAGVNGYTNIFFLIIVTRSVVLYLEKKEKALVCALKCAATLFVAALAELKFYYVEFIVAVLLAVLFTNFTWRKLWLIVGGIVGVVGGAALLVVFFPDYVGWFSLEWMLEVATADRGYTSSGDLNRLNAIDQINELWLKEWPQRIFGLGLGNCDTASFDIVNTPFFKQHGDMHYTWMSHAMMYLENGYVGLIFYYGFFVLAYLGARRIEKRSTGTVRSYCRIGRIMAVMCMVIAVYNASLRAEGAYMAYFVLAIPFALGRNAATNGTQPAVGRM